MILETCSLDRIENPRCLACFVARTFQIKISIGLLLFHVVDGRKFSLVFEKVFVESKIFRVFDVGGNVLCCPNKSPSDEEYLAYLAACHFLPCSNRLPSNEEYFVCSMVGNFL